MTHININRIATSDLSIPIVGTAPLIVHKFSEKAKQTMLDKMQGRKTPKQSKDPTAEYEACFYRTKGGSYGFPAAAFKQATVGAARFFGKDVKMTELRQCMFFYGETSDDETGSQQLVEITGSPHMREDVVRVGQGTDLRYRPEFPDWSTTLHVRYVNSLLTQDSLLSLIEAGGMGVGVGEWRPEKRGEFGTYAIDTTREILETIR